MKTQFQLTSIKRAGFAVLCILISGLSFSQSPGGSSFDEFYLPGSEFQDEESVYDKWPAYSISLNAADIIVMGPMLEADFRIGAKGKTYLGVFYVNHGMGLLAGQLIYDKDITSHSLKSMGAGIHAKQYFKQNIKRNAFYCGLYLGYSYNEAVYHSGYPNEEVEKVKDLLLFASGGYRWNFGKYLYVLTGIQFGFAYTFSDDIYSSYTLDPVTGTYLKQTSYSMELPSDIYPYPLPEITIGIAF
jgi:hypothetical protein